MGFGSQIPAEDTERQPDHLREERRDRRDVVQQQIPVSARRLPLLQFNIDIVAVHAHPRYGIQGASHATSRLTAYVIIPSCLPCSTLMLSTVPILVRGQGQPPASHLPPPTPPNPLPLTQRDWSAFYSPGHEIQAHLQDVVDKYKLMRHIKLSHEVVHARYDEPSGQWHVRVRRPLSSSPSSPSSSPPFSSPADTIEMEYEEIEDVADVLFTAFGAITRWKMPAIPGLADFKGELHHTAGYKPASGETWESDLERWKDKRVGVVGSVRLPCISLPRTGVLSWNAHVCVCRARRRSRSWRRSRRTWRAWRTMCAARRGSRRRSRWTWCRTCSGARRPLQRTTVSPSLLELAVRGPPS